MTLIEVKLNSGAKLEMNVAPFADAKALYQACLKELAGIEFKGQMDQIEMMKSVICRSFASPEIERCLSKCFERCRYNGGKLTMDCFEPVEARDDYMQVCIEVGKVNIMPFLKSLYAEYLQFSSILENIQA